MTAIGNTLAFWNREQFGIELTPGVDEVSLALVADAWSRTYRSRAMTFAAAAGALHDAQRHPHSSRSGRRQAGPPNVCLPAIGDQPPAKALDQALHAIETRYGMQTADFVAMQLEYPRP